MGDLTEALEQDHKGRRPRGSRCSIEKLIERLRRDRSSLALEFIEVLTARLDDGELRYSGRAIERAMAGLGVTVSQHVIGRHRRAACRCHTLFAGESWVFNPEDN